MEEVQKIFRKRGSKALEMARKEVLEEVIECKEVREALKYFMMEYWQDLARPALLSLCCEAVGGDPDATIPVAIPLSLISGGIDIHDDIIDQSPIKDGRPTVYGRFGKDVALLAGDALLFKGLTLLHKSDDKGIPAEKLQVINDIIKRMFFELGNAEALELKFRGRLDVTPEEYLRVVKNKAADVEAHTRVSAILGGGSRKEIEALGEYGRLLGMLIILRDDWIDMMDFDEARHRIKMESLPLPILYALRNSRIKPAISSILVKETIDEGDAERILEITREFGGIQRFERLVRELAEETYSKLEFIKYNAGRLELLVLSAIPPLLQSENSATSTRI
jgi:geranylgeranyl pyrophosphate synthase